MSTIERDFDLRKESILLLYNHIVVLSEEKSTVKISAIIKASFYIALYNNVEATFYSIFELIHDTVSKYKYSSLSCRLKSMIDDISSKNQSHLPTLENYIKKKKLYSGNLDHRKGKALFKQYGIPFNNDFEKKITYSLLIIKNKRNKIAHGEESLSQAGRNISHIELKNIADNSFTILLEYIKSALLYLKEQQYLLR
ncbi:hypothetical protein I4558_11385 [Proteus mirabilis]|nr:hypothetical protein [Proteus mirabilis]MBG2767990.1 hypothetical protein [Proteus mirabilis]